MLMLQETPAQPGSGLSGLIMLIILIAILWGIISLFMNIASGANRSGRGLYRSHKTRVIAGVCGGIAEQLNISPITVRLLWIISGIGLPAYFLLWLIVPEDNRYY